MLTIHYEEGNLLTLFRFRKWTAIAHGCNCWNKMGRGIALKIRRVYPEAYEADLRSGCGNREKLGNVSYAVVNGNQYVFNLYSQFYYSKVKKVMDYSALNSALRTMINVLTKRITGDITIGIPYIGSYNAGGTKEELKTVLESIQKAYKGNHSISITVVEFTPQRVVLSSSF